MTTRLRAMLVVISVFVLQVSAFSEMRLRGVSPDVLLLLAVIVAFHGGPHRGALVGFAGGLLYDVFLPTPLGMSALVYTVIAYGIGAVQDGLQRSTWQANVLGIAATSALGMLLYAMAGEVLGQSTFPGVSVLDTLAWGAVYSILLAPPINRAAQWMLGDTDDARPVRRLSVVE